MNTRQRAELLETLDFTVDAAALLSASVALSTPTLSTTSGASCCASATSSARSRRCVGSQSTQARGTTAGCSRSSSYLRSGRKGGAGRAGRRRRAREGPGRRPGTDRSTAGDGGYACKAAGGPLAGARDRGRGHAGLGIRDLPGRERRLSERIRMCNCVCRRCMMHGIAYVESTLLYLSETTSFISHNSLSPVGTLTRHPRPSYQNMSDFYAPYRRRWRRWLKREDRRQLQRLRTRRWLARRRGGPELHQLVALDVQCTLAGRDHRGGRRSTARECHGTTSAATRTASRQRRRRCTRRSAHSCSEKRLCRRVCRRTDVKAKLLFVYVLHLTT